LLRFRAAAVAGVSGTSVERFAASSAAAGVLEGCAGGGWRRLITGLREPQLERPTQRIQETQSTLRKKEAEHNECWLPRGPERKAEFAGRACARIGSLKTLKGVPAS
jgi:hypothetical protein